ncbi:hypothetical protein C0033_25265 [Clostridium sp. chh4-2]|nr:hypothetical protein C0033_25265 [Clostridium sp. chh4-2]
MSQIFSIFLNTFQPVMLLSGFFGTLFGVVLGAIPGLNGGIGIAVMLPFTYTMPPAVGLLFLGGIYMGSGYGGAISAILLNVPGTVNAACTAIEGSCMAKKGKGKEALYYAVLASCVGGFVGVVALILCTPLLAKLSLRFGPPEMFLVSLCGLAIVGSMSSGKVLRGIMSAFLGLFLSMIGMQASTGFTRFTFGSKLLLSGIDTIPAIIGLFAISEMIHQAYVLKNSEEQKINYQIENNIRAVTAIKGMMTTFRSTLLKSSLMGTFIGILPGTGGAIASFLAYSEAKRISKEPEQFGKGAPDGIVAVESANNAAVGGSMVPMLGLGIPGSTNSAIMLGALTIHGLIPGNQLFTETPEVAYGFLFGMLLTVVFMGVIGIFGIPLFSQILKVKMKYIIPAVIMCCLLGAYSSRNSMADVFFACIFAVIGFVFTKLDIPSAPLLLGLILGGIIEKNFVKTLSLANAHNNPMVLYIIKRPLCIGILAVVLYLIYSNARDGGKAKKIKKEIN